MGELTAFAGWLWKCFTVITVIGRNILVEIINSFIELFAETANTLVQSLPAYTCPTPGQMLQSFDGFLGALNWVLPIGFFLDCLTMLCFGYTLHFAMSPALRFFKLTR